MAKITEPAETLVDTIKNDTQCVATTSESTLNLLRALLGVDLVHETSPRASPLANPGSKPQRSKPATNKGASLRVKPSKRPAETSFNVFEGAPPTIPPLSVEKRRRLA